MRRPSATMRDRDETYWYRSSASSSLSCAPPWRSRPVRVRHGSSQRTRVPDGDRAHDPILAKDGHRHRHGAGDQLTFAWSLIPVITIPPSEARSSLSVGVRSVMRNEVLGEDFVEDLRRRERQQCTTGCAVRRSGDNQPGRDGHPGAFLSTWCRQTDAEADTPNHDRRVSTRSSSASIRRAASAYG